MTFPPKKTSPRGALQPQPFKPGQSTAGVLQPKGFAPQPQSKSPAAPPAYRPQPAPKCLQPKVAQQNTVQQHTGPQAPPAYRPQPVPKCLQPKTATTGQARQQPPPQQPARQTVLQPHVHPAQQRTAAHKGTVSQPTPPRNAPTNAAAASRTAQPKQNLTHAHATPTTPPLPRATMPVGHASKNTSVQAKSVIQRVGAVKVAVARASDVQPDNPAVTQVNDILTRYKGKIKRSKEDAKAAFTGHEKDIHAQTTYTNRLTAAEVDVDKLKRKINKTSTLEVGLDNQIKEKGTGKVVASINRGISGYDKISDPGGPILHSIYRKKSLDGTGSGEYIQINGHMLRRYAYRGITPIEMAQIDSGQRHHGMVTPIFNTDDARRANQSGVHFENGVGHYRTKPDKYDLNYIKSFARDVRELTPEMYAFAHARRGVGKLFSFRSTPKEITSNHGASFSQCGEIRVDLAQVATADFIFHYAGGGAWALQSGIQNRDITDRHRHDEELRRAQESVLRNREIILKQYPADAAQWRVRPNIPVNDIERQGFQDEMQNRGMPAFVLDQAAYDRGRDNARLQKQGFSDGKADGRNARRRHYARNEHSYQNGYDDGYAQGTEFATGWRDGYADGKRGQDRNWARNSMAYLDGHDEGYTDGRDYARGWTHGHDDSSRGQGHRYGGAGRYYRNGYDDGYAAGRPRERGSYTSGPRYSPYR